MPINQFLVGSLTGALLVSAADVPSPPTLSEKAHWIRSADTTTSVSPAANPVTSASVDWKSRLSANARSLSDLRPGWDGPASLDIPERLVVRTVFYVQTVLEGVANALAPRLVPGGDGSIQIEWHTKRGELEFDIDSHGNMSIWGRDHLSGAEFSGEDEKALALFYRWAPRLASRQADALHVSAQAQMATFAVAA